MKHVGLSNAKPQHRGSSHRPCPGNKRPAPLRIPRSAAAPAAALPGAARRRAWGQRRRVPGTAPVRTPRAEVPRRPLCSVPAAQAPARRPLPSPCRRRRRCRCRYAGSARSPPAGSGGTDRSPGSWRAPGAPRLPPGPGRGGAQGGRTEGAPAAGPTPPPVTIARLHAAAAADHDEPPGVPAPRRRAEPGHTHQERSAPAAPRSGCCSNMASARRSARPHSRSRPARHCAAAIPEVARSRRALRAPGLRARRERRTRQTLLNKVGLPARGPSPSG